MLDASAVNAAPVNAGAQQSGVALMLRLRCSAVHQGSVARFLVARTHGMGGALLPVNAHAHKAGRVLLALRARCGVLLGSGSVQLGLRARSVDSGVAQTGPGHLWVSVRQPVSTAPVPSGQTPPAGSVGGAYHTWCVQATAQTPLRVTGTVSVSAEENGARTASLSVAGDATAQTGSIITLSLQVGAAQSLLYRGRIVRAQYNPDSDITSLSCSDGLQAVADALTVEQIDAMTPGAISPPGDASTGYARLVARLSTIPMSAILRADGTLAVVPWSAQAGGQITRILHGSFTVEQTAAETDDAASGAVSGSGSGSGSTQPPVRRKAWRITIDLSWIRIARMRYSAGWSAGEIDLCKWLDKWPRPQEDTIRSAVYGCGWDVESFGVTKMALRSQWVTCNGAMSALLVPPGLIAPATYATWTISRRYTRAMRAKATWLVKDRATKPTDVLDVSEVRISIKDPRDGRDWIDFGTGAPPALLVDVNGDEYADLLDIRDASAQFGTPLAQAQAQMMDAMQRVAVVVAQATIKIAKQRRLRTASATTVIDPTLDIGQAVTLAHPRLSMTGMIRRVSHTLDTQRGSATTTVEVAQYAPPTSAATAPAGYAPQAVHTFTPGNLTGGLLAAALQRACRVPTRDASAPLPHPAQTPIGGVQDMLPTPDPTADPLFQGWVANREQSVAWTYGNPPPFKPVYPNTGFFVRSPEIKLPDQEQVIDLGEALILI